MTDLQKAKSALSGHSIALCKGDDIIISDKRGIAPMVGFIAEGKDLNGYSAADLVVGKAAAMLFIKAGVAAVYAQTLSESGKAMLECYGVPVEYFTLTQKIINRDKTDICPMERAVLNTDDIEEGYNLIKQKLGALGKNNRI